MAVRLPSRPSVVRAVGHIGLAALAAWLYTLAGEFKAGASYRVGPDLWPRIVLVLIGAIAVARAAVALAARPGPAAPAELAEPRGPSGPEARRLGLSALAIAGYGLALPVVGFVVLTPLFLFALTSILGERRPAVALLSAVTLSAAIIGIFRGLFYVPLPTGRGPFETVSRAVFGLF